MRIINTTKRASATLVATMLLVLATIISSSARADLVNEQSAHGSDSKNQTTNSQGWDQLLRNYVKDGVVNYQGITDRRDILDSYLNKIEDIGRSEFESLSRQDQIAFWINAYNAHTIKLILDNRPLSSIYDVVPLWKKALGNTPFNIPFIKLGNLDPTGATAEMLTLEDIENRILRGHYKEPRIHFTIVCASKSCPALASHAYTGDHLEEQLEAAGRAFLADTRKNSYDAEANKLRLSPIFKWFRTDFESSGTLVDFVSHYLPQTERDSLNARLLKKNAPGIEFRDYDWSLNAAADYDNATEPSS